jgi:hypothetical protein
MTMEKIATELAAIRETISSLDSKIGALGSNVGSLDSKVSSLDSTVGSLGSTVGTLGSKLDSLDARMRIGFEETHRLIKLGFESVQILDEKIDRRFDETERQHADHKIVLEAAIKGLSRDVHPPRGPALRRRR